MLLLSDQLALSMLHDLEPVCSGNLIHTQVFLHTHTYIMKWASSKSSTWGPTGEEKLDVALTLATDTNTHAYFVAH